VPPEEGFSEQHDRPADTACQAEKSVTAGQPKATIRLMTIGCLRVRPQIGGLQVIGRNCLSRISASGFAWIYDQLLESRSLTI
jgi:hypothetical protein